MTLTSDGALYALTGANATRTIGARGLAARVHDVIEACREVGLFTPVVDGWLTGFSPALSRRLGDAGLIGTGLPARYGGQDGTAIDRFVVTETLLISGAPVAAHWFGERQVAPALLRHGTTQQCDRFIPDIVAGQCYFSIGMSEPDAGSDLAAVATRARRTGEGWRISGTKVWTSHAEHSHYVLLLCRTSESGRNRRAGLSQFIVPLDADGVTVRPIPTMDGGTHFAEVHFDDVRVSDSDMVGPEGHGWHQVVEELVFERTGAERMLSTFPLLLEAHKSMGGWEGAQPAQTLGRLLLDAFALRELIASAVESIAHDELVPPVTAIAKDLATRYEQRLIDDVRDVRSVLEAVDGDEEMERLRRQAQLIAPTLTLRGGANEVLRTIVARDLAKQVSRPVGIAL